MLSCCFQYFVCIGGIISSCNSSILVASTALRDSTLGVFLSHPWKFGSAGFSLCWKCCFFVFSYDNIADNSLSDVNVFLVKGEKGCVVCGCFNASDNSNSALDAVSADDNLGILYCLGKNSTVSHTHSADVFCNMYCTSPVMM